MSCRLLKLIFICLLITLIWNASFGQSEYIRNLKSLHIRGDVDSVIDDEIRVINNDSTKTNIDTRNVFYFNEKGLLTEWTTNPYWANQQFHIVNAKPLKITYNYDKDGNLIERLHYGSNGSLSEKTTYTIPSSTSEIESRGYYMPNHQALITIGKLLLDKKGNVIDESSYDPILKPEFKHTYRYDENNYCIEDINVNVTTLKESKTIFFYHEDDLVEEISYDYLGGVFSTYIYRYTNYDQKHNWTAQRLYINGHLRKIVARTIFYRK